MNEIPDKSSGFDVWVSKTCYLSKENLIDVAFL
jgi:hypothetical protein